MAVSKVIFCVGERANQRRTKEGKERPVRAAGNWTRVASSVRGVRKEHHAFKISPSHGGKGYCLRGEIGSELAKRFSKNQSQRASFDNFTDGCTDTSLRTALTKVVSTLESSCILEMTTHRNFSREGKTLLVTLVPKIFVTKKTLDFNKRAIFRTWFEIKNSCHLLSAWPLPLLSPQGRALHHPKDGNNKDFVSTIPCRCLDHLLPSFHRRLGSSDTPTKLQAEKQHSEEW
ncbi:hypothetical protein QQP08_015218 [Theobroma cacao]|nr:hypothetical protein QQP08_015218 [Theobroma cacao]